MSLRTGILLITFLSFVLALGWSVADDAANGDLLDRVAMMHTGEPRSQIRHRLGTPAFSVQSRMALNREMGSWGYPPVAADEEIGAVVDAYKAPDLFVCMHYDRKGGFMFSTSHHRGRTTAQVIERE